MPVGLAAPFQPCLTWADVVAAVDDGLEILGSLLPDEKLRRGYETLGRELAERIRTHPNRIADSPGPREKGPRTWECPGPA